MQAANRLTKKLMLVVGLLFPAFSQAQFDIMGVAELTLKTGTAQEINYGFRYFRQEGEYYFVAGEQKLTVPSVPQKYSIALILHNNTDVWIPDFSKTPVQSFILNIADTEIRLSQNPEASTAPGNFVLQLNDDIYYFNRGPGQINFYFTEDGISNIKIEGMLKPKK